MILCLDVGNSNIYGGVFHGDNIHLRFRHATMRDVTSDQLGVFLTSVLNANNIDPKKITQIAICSVVPPIDYSLRAACIKYFSLEPFVLQAGVKTGLKINYRNPLEVGADRIANAIAAIHHFPKKNIIIIDFGTATTVCAVSANKDYCGGVILAGIRISMDALQAKAAKIPSVEIISPEIIIGRSTIENVQSGLYYGQLGAVREVTQRLTQEIFLGKPTVIIGTGGFVHLFEKENIFSIVIHDLVLHGLRLALQLNTKKELIS
jgi:type III pantothenate kinase